LAGIAKLQQNQACRLAQAVVERNQRLLFSAEALQRMRHMQFGKSSEKREEDDCSPLFGKEAADAEDNSTAGEIKNSGIPAHPWNIGCLGNGGSRVSWKMF
jgi:hypothetical protein